MLSANAITFRYPKRSTPVFENYNLEVHSGITLFKGFSGCGKSTLLRLFAGYLQPQSGSISIPPTHQSPDIRFKRERLGYLFQKLNLIPNLSIRHNMMMAAEIAALNPEQIEANLARWATHLHIEALLDKSPSELSVGQQQRAAIARVFIKEPEIIILDEPTSGLDDHNTTCIINALNDYMTPSRYCLIATHDSRLETLKHQTHSFPSTPL